MRVLLAILSMSALSVTAFGQGIVNFANSPSTLVGYITERGYSGLISGTNTWYFALLTGPTPNGPFSFTGVYATNSAIAPGRFVNNGVQVPNWAPGTTQYYQVAAWSFSLGPTFNPNWLLAYPTAPFALSQVGSGIAGGYLTGSPPLPPLPLFGGTGIGSGFTFVFVPDLRLWAYATGGVLSGFKGFNITGLTGSQLIIEASTNLARQSWVQLQSLTLTNTFLFFSDPQWTNYPSRFYRVRSP